MDRQRFELYCPVVAHVVRTLLPPVDGVVLDAEVDDATGAVLRTLDGDGEAAALRQVALLCELERTAADRPGDALRAALAGFVPPPEHPGNAAAARLRVVTDELYPPTPGPAPTEGPGLPQSAREQQAELVRFLLGEQETEPLIAAIAARLARCPEYEAELRAAHIRPELLRQIKEYAALLPGGPHRQFDAMLSYCTQDLDEVVALWSALEQFDLLERQALRVWFDRRDMLLGFPALSRLCRVIELIHKYVFCCGRSLGRYQDLEMDQMVRRVREGPGEHQILPVILASVAQDHDPVPPLLRTYVRVDLRSTSHAIAVRCLREAIRA